MSHVEALQKDYSRTRLLLVEDDDGLRRSLIRVMTICMNFDKGNITDVGSLDEARAALEKGSFDILITDKDYPHEKDGRVIKDSGFELLAHGNRPTAAILITGDKMDIDGVRSQLIRLKAEVVFKPATIDELQEAIDRQLGKSAGVRK